MHPRKRIRASGSRLLGVVSLVGTSLTVAPPVYATADSYPSKPITLVVPFPPGGPADLLGRLVAKDMSESFGQQVVVDNRDGANTVIGAQAVARAKPDGYTLLLAIDSTLAMNPSLYSKLSYDPAKDFDSVALVAEVPCLIAVNPSVPANNLQELLDLARAKPDGIDYAHGAVTMHVGGELLNRMADVRMRPIAYRGGGTTSLAAMSGEVDVTFESAAAVLQHVKTGKLRALAIMGSRRVASAPEIPTVSEAGVPGYEVAVWQSIVVPTGTPRPIIDKLNAELRRIMEKPETRERLEAAGLAPLVSTPEEMDEFVRAETEKWSHVIKDIGLKFD